LIIGLFLISAMAVLGSNTTVDAISTRGKPSNPGGGGHGGGDSGSSLAITAPADGDTVSGIVTIIVTGGSRTPTITIDGSAIGSGNSVDWDTTLFTDGPHQIQAKAKKDTAIVNVFVDNGGGSDPDPTPTGAKVALVIGISDYDGHQNDLTYCDDDARDMKAALEGFGFDVTILTDRQATADNIEAALIALDGLEDADS
jgi:hypothetical protein